MLFYTFINILSHWCPGPKGRRRNCPKNAVRNKIEIVGLFTLMLYILLQFFSHVWTFPGLKPY